MHVTPKPLDIEVQPPVVNASFLSSQQEDDDDEGSDENKDSEFTSEEQKVSFLLFIFYLPNFSSILYSVALQCSG